MTTLPIGFCDSHVSMSGRTATIYVPRKHGCILGVHEPVYPLGGLGFWLTMEPTHFRLVGRKAALYESVIASGAARALMEHYGDATVRRVTTLMVSIDGQAPVRASEEVIELFFLTTKFNTGIDS